MNLERSEVVCSGLSITHDRQLYTEWQSSGHSSDNIECVGFGVDATVCLSD